METDENEDLLVVSDNSDIDVTDYAFHEKVVNILEKENDTHKSLPGNILLISSCVILFISSTILIVTLPVYIQQSRRAGITTYSKLFTISAANAVIFTIILLAAKWLKKCVANASNLNTHLNLCLPNICKASLLLSIGSLLVFCLIDEQLISCHLQDPLKGCVVVFSLTFYFLFARRRTSVERVFCTITSVVGTFVTVDFGLCNRFRCRGSDIPDTQLNPHVWHGVYVVAYVLGLAAFALHFTVLENCCRSVNYSSNLDLSICGQSTSFAPTSPSYHRSLSIISAIPSGPPNAPMDNPKFPQTSTPNISEDRRMWGAFGWLAAHHWLSWLLVIICCWVPTTSYSSNNQRLLADVAQDVISAVSCHVFCTDLFLPSVIMLTSYVFFAISAMFVLLTTRSALTLSVVLMNSLPMMTLFWSVYQLDSTSADMVRFKWAVTGEAVSAMLGFPITGVATFLMLKSHVSTNKMQASFRFRHN